MTYFIFLVTVKLLFTFHNCLRDLVTGYHPLRLLKPAVLPSIRIELAHRSKLQNPVPSLNVSKFGHIIYPSHCATSRKVAGSIPEGVIEIFY